MKEPEGEDLWSVGTVYVQLAKPTLIFTVTTCLTTCPTTSPILFNVASTQGVFEIVVRLQSREIFKVRFSIGSKKRNELFQKRIPSSIFRFPCFRENFSAGLYEQWDNRTAM